LSVCSSGAAPAPRAEPARGQAPAGQPRASVMGTTTRSSRRAAAIACAVALVAFLVVLAARWQHGFANVDDYLYARQAHEFARALANGPAALVEAWRAFGQNAPLVPTLAAPLAAIDPSPHLLTLAHLPFVLLLAASCTVLPRALGLAGARLALAAAAAASAPPLLAWAAMFHFAFASAALTVAALAAYMLSRGLRSPAASALFGLAIGLLCVARVIGPLYASALIAAVAGDQLTRHGDWRERLRGALVACSSAVLVATPWWAAAGGSALRYLTTAGYGESPFTHEAGLLERARERFDWTTTETGWLVACVVLALAALGLARALRNDRSRRPALLMAITALCAMTGLATSTNAGTGFALPAIALAVCLAAFAVAAPPARRSGRPAAGLRGLRALCWRVSLTSAAGLPCSMRYLRQASGSDRSGSSAHPDSSRRAQRWAASATHLTATD